MMTNGFFSQLVKHQLAVKDNMPKFSLNEFFSNLVAVFCKVWFLVVSCGDTDIDNDVLCIDLHAVGGQSTAPCVLPPLPSHPSLHPQPNPPPQDASLHHLPPLLHSTPLPHHRIQTGLEDHSGQPTHTQVEWVATRWDSHFSHKNN